MMPQRPMPVYGRCLLLCLFLCATFGGTNASAFKRWSSYVPQPVQAPCTQAAQASKAPIGMWGCNGESWNSTGPLTDWSFAGYGAGMEQIPDAPVTVDIKRDFQAAGDGLKDDTAAVLAALKATQNNGGVIFFPPGKYLLTAQLNMSSNQVLRGGGRDTTTLFFNTSLQQLYGWGPNWEAGRENSPYTWAGGLISTQRETRMFNPSTLYLANVTKPAARGDKRLYVNGFTGNSTRPDHVFVPGQWISLSMFETPQADMAKAFCNNRTEVGARLGPDFGNRQMFTHMTRITAVGPDWIDTERPLHVDVSLQFKPTVYRSFNFKVTGVGVEDLTIEFPWTPYLGHHEEPGYNAIEYEAAVNSWVRRVRVINSDSAIKLYSSIFNTVSDVLVETSPKPRRGGRWYGREEVVQEADKDGHMAIALHWACFDNVVEKFNITSLFYHELLVAGYSAHNVFQNGSGTDVCLDHHGGAPHNNLWTDIDLGSGQAAMRWSGAPEHFPFAGSNNVFWNIWASKIPVTYDYVGRLANSGQRMDMYQQKRMKLPVMSRPASIQGYGQVVVDMPLDNNIPPIKEAGDWFIYYKPNERVWPSNLFVAMQTTQAMRMTLAGQPKTLAELTGQKLPRAPAAKPPQAGNLTAGPPSIGSQASNVTQSPAKPQANNATTTAPAAPAAPGKASNLTTGLTAPQANLTGLTAPQANLTTGLTAPQANLTTGLTAPQANLTTGLTAPQANLTTGLTAPKANLTTSLTATPANLTGLTAPQANLTTGLTAPQTNLTGQPAKPAVAPAPTAGPVQPQVPPPALKASSQQQGQSQVPAAPEPAEPEMNNSAHKSPIAQPVQPPAAPSAKPGSQPSSNMTGKAPAATAQKPQQPAQQQVPGKPVTNNITNNTPAQPQPVQAPAPLRTKVQQPSKDTSTTKDELMPKAEVKAGTNRPNRTQVHAQPANRRAVQVKKVARLPADDQAQAQAARGGSSNKQTTAARLLAKQARIAARRNNKVARPSSTHRPRPIRNMDAKAGRASPRLPGVHGKGQANGHRLSSQQ